MRDSRRRLGHSPVKRSEAMHLAAVQGQYLLHHGALGHSEKTISHYRDTFRLLERFTAETGNAATTAILSTSGMNEFAMWLRTTPTKRLAGRDQTHRSGNSGHDDRYAGLCSVGA